MLFDAVVAAASGATVLHVRFCTRWYRFDVFDAASGGTVLMWSPATADVFDAASGGAVLMC